MGRPSRGKGKGRAGPSDPQDIMLRRAQERAAARIGARDPGQWGVAEDLLRLDSSNDPENGYVHVDAVDGHGTIRAARRSDPYDLLHAATVTDQDGATRRGLSDEQHRAARRLFRDMALAAGVREDRDWLRDHIDGGRGDPGAPTQGMIDASRRAAVVLAGVGPVSARILQALNGSMIAGEVRPWRGIVLAVTQEKDRNAQGALVRQACEGLVLVYQALDERARAAAAANRELRPFGSFGPTAT